MYRCTTRAVSPRIHRGAKARVVAAASASNRSRAASADSNRDTGSQRSPNSTFRALRRDTGPIERENGDEDRRPYRNHPENAAHAHP
jgi:hypothetical protein